MIVKGSDAHKKLYNQVFKTINDPNMAHDFERIQQFEAVIEKHGREVKQRSENPVHIYMKAAKVRRHMAALLKVKFDSKVRQNLVLKRMVRILEKSLLRHGQDAGNADRICDIVRDMYVADSIKEIAEVVSTMCEWKSIVVVRIKDRFHKPSYGGWRDVMVNYYLADDHDKDRHICELQIVHSMMVTAREGLSGHAIYNRVRNAAEILEHRLGSAKAGELIEKADESMKQSAKLRKQSSTLVK